MLILLILLLVKFNKCFDFVFCVVRYVLRRMGICLVFVVCFDKVIILIGEIKVGEYSLVEYSWFYGVILVDIRYLRVFFRD